MQQTTILTLDEAYEQLPLQKKPMILAGGCFDILHAGHKAFLEASRQDGYILAILLESDKRISETKGEKRPHFTQVIRAQNLASLHLVDYIILLPYLSENTAYDNVIFSLKPAIITTTAGDPYRFHKERQAAMVGAKVIDVITRLPEHSTTKILTTYE